MILWQLSLDGGHDSETGTVDTGGWFGRFTGQVTPETVLAGYRPGDEYATSLAALVLNYGYTAEELLAAMVELRLMVGAIIVSDQQGFVYGTLFRDRTALDVAWSLIEEDHDDDEPE
jgi:hypothetical protein